LVCRVQNRKPAERALDRPAYEKIKNRSAAQARVLYKTGTIREKIRREHPYRAIEPPPYG